MKPTPVLPARSVAPARLAALALLSALALPGCGGQTEADRIRSVLSDIAKHPLTLCEKYATGGMLLRTGGKGGCERTAAAASAVDPGQKVLDVDVHGLSAIAHVRGRGGKNVVYLTKIGSDWKVGNTG